MSQSPGRKRKDDQRDLRPDVACIKEKYGFDVVVTLLEKRELEVMVCQDIAEVVESNRMCWLNFPIRDKWIPADTHAFLTHVVRPVAQWVDEGKKVLVHCNGGKGRTGTVVASVLMTRAALGDHRARSVSEAIRRMRECRKGMLKN